MNTPEAEFDTINPDDAIASGDVSVAIGSSLEPAEVLERVRRGELIENARIVGLKLKGEFPLPVRFRNVTLVQLTIDRATFADEVAFEHCTLDRVKSTRTATFAKGLNLSASTLVKADLRGLIVTGTFRCDNIRTLGRFLVEGAKFLGRVRFWEAQFRGWVEFKACEFGDADFRSFHAEQGFVLDKCIFRGAALFRGIYVSKKWQADGTRFEGLLDLSKAKLHDFVYLEAIDQGPGMRFAFTNALAERILVRPDQLDGRLASEMAGDHAQAMQEYGLLKRIFEALHRYEHEDWAFYRFKVNQRLAKPRSWRSPWSKVSQFGDWLLLDKGCGYGTSPSRAIRAALLIVVAFAVIYAAGIDQLNVERTPFGGDPTTAANRCMIAALTSVSAFTSGFGDIRGAAQGWMNLPLIAESLLGTLLWGLFIVAFSRKVIR
jgi:uncharacterized protein YjbI with pentapeptide repeats